MSKSVALLLVLVFLTASGIVFFLAKINSDNLPSGANEVHGVEITDFNWTTGWGPGPVGVMWTIGFNITLCNSGTKDLDGLTLTLKMSDAKGNELQTEAGFYGPGVIGYSAEFGPFDGILHAKEVRTLRGYISSVTGAWNIHPIITLAQISLNGTVLDELYIYQTP
jgi:hypothetical protein